jgi:predicted acetyltransferase
MQLFAIPFMADQELEEGTRQPMDIRPLQTEEAEKLAALYMNAYRVDRKTVDGWIRYVDFATTRSFAAEKRAYSVIQIIPFRTVIGGRELPMGGIGGVATWADQQGRGYAGRLMSYSVREMRDLGFPVSYLFPFSYRYYGKFGWSIAAKRLVYQDFTIASIQPQSRWASVRALLPEEYHLLKPVYTAGLPKYNGPLVRDEVLWERRFEFYRGDRVQPYLVEDGETAVGYFVCEDLLEQGKFGYETNVNEFVFLNELACASMFNFLRCLPTNVMRIRVNSPELPNLWQYFREPFVDTRLFSGFQARVVDMKAALEQRGYPEDVSASVTFSVADEHGPWNEGTWTVTVEGGAARVEQSGGSAGVELSIQEFSSIFIGLLDPLALGRGEAPTLRGMRSIFHDKPTRIIDFF